MILIIGITVPSVFCILAAVLSILVKKGFICRETSPKQNVIVHQNDLYGNLTNQDYFDQRYDTKITDTNQYYDGEDEDVEYKS